MINRASVPQMLDDIGNLADTLLETPANEQSLGDMQFITVFAIRNIKCCLESLAAEVEELKRKG